jgi:hypothetical protein
MYREPSMIALRIWFLSIPLSTLRIIQCKQYPGVA